MAITTFFLKSAITAITRSHVIRNLNRPHYESCSSVRLSVSIRAPISKTIKKIKNKNCCEFFSEQQPAHALAASKRSAASASYDPRQAKGRPHTCRHVFVRSVLTWAGANDRFCRRFVKHHGLDVEWTENRLLVDEIAVFDVTVASRQNDAHVAHVDTTRAQVSSV